MVHGVPLSQKVGYTQKNMKTTLKHKDANVLVEALPSGKHKICVELLDHDSFIPINTCETSYPLDLIGMVLNVKGPAYLCYEILRDESPDYVQRRLEYDLLSYVDKREFDNTRLLDFGCGSGASTMALARMFPHTRIVGVELKEQLLFIANMRAQYYDYTDMEFFHSPDSRQLPPDIGHFDYAVLCAVYEHLLQHERIVLLQNIWKVLKPGGILFLNQTPYRYFPIETHTTGGLPFINYLPDRAALVYSQHFSRRILKDKSWEDLLRQGIRGGSVWEICAFLDKCSHKPILLNPSMPGIRDRIDLWHIKSQKAKSVVLKRLFLYSAKFLKMATGITILPVLSLAIKKDYQ